jgi:hypothetical protein
MCALPTPAGVSPISSRATFALSWLSTFMVPLSICMVEKEGAPKLICGSAWRRCSIAAVSLSCIAFSSCGLMIPRACALAARRGSSCVLLSARHAPSAALSESVRVFCSACAVSMSLIDTGLPTTCLDTPFDTTGW